MSKTIGISLIVSVCLFSGPGRASWLKDADFTSNFDLKALNFPLPDASAVNTQLVQGDFKLGLVVQGENVKFTGKLEDVADPMNNSPEEQNYFDLPEFNFKFKVKSFLFKIGTDIYNWGVTDAINPVDVVNTQVYFDPIHPRKMGAGSVSLNYAEDWFEADVVFTPWARPSLMPGSNSRWLPRQIYLAGAAAGTGLSGIELLLPNQFNYSYLPRQVMGTPLQNNAAVRLQAHLNNLELAVYGYDGVAAFPIITPIVGGTTIAAAPLKIIQVYSDVQLQLNDYREQIGGFSFVKTFKSTQIKGEATWTQPAANVSSLQGWRQTGILGLEQTWSMGSKASLVTVLQYSSSSHSSPAGNDLLSFQDIFDSNSMLGGHFSWRDNDAINFFYSYDWLTTSWLGDLSYSRRFSDNISLTLGGTTMDGPPTSPLGVYASNKSIFADLGWSY